MQRKGSSSGRITITLAMAICLACGLVSPLGAQTEVPREYRLLYEFLDRQIAAAERHWYDRPPRAGAVFTAELLSANAAQGDLLLEDRTYQGTVLLMDRLQRMGFGGVWISISYPMLLPEYPNSAGYLAYYKRVVQEARRRGLTVCVDMGSFFADPNLTRTHYDYSRLTLASFAEGMRRMAQVILAELKPDYLGILNEPDTQAKNTGLDLSAANLRQFTATVLSGLDRGTTRIGIGAGTWTPVRYFEMFARDTTVDCIDLHIYPVNRDYMTGRIDQIARLAVENGKRLVIGESWLYKAVEAELGGDIAAAAGIFARDVYDFWTPLDRRFIAAVMRLARAEDACYANFFWSRSFFGAVPYTPATAKIQLNEAVALLQEAVRENTLQGRLSPLGDAVAEMLRSQ